MPDNANDAIIYQETDTKQQNSPLSIQYDNARQCGLRKQYHFKQLYATTV